MPGACWPAGLPSLLAVFQASKRACLDFKKVDNACQTTLEVVLQPTHIHASAHMNTHTQREKKVKEEAVGRKKSFTHSHVRQ